MNLEGIQEVANEIKESGQQALAIKADITCTKNINNLIVKAKEQFGTIDILVNNAGVFDKYQTSLDTDLNKWNFLLNINLTSTFQLSNAVLPDMIEKQSGSIVNIASVAGLVAGKGGATYTTAKHAVIGYTEYLASEYAKYNIKINAIAPGTIETPLIKDVAANIPKDTVPAKRFGQVADSDCIENTLQIKLFSMLISLDGVGRRNLYY